LHNLLNFCKNIKESSILQVGINFWVFSDVCTRFHPNQRHGSVKICRVRWDVLRAVYYSLVLFTCQRVYENIWLLRDLTPGMDEMFAEHKYLSYRKPHGAQTCNLISRAPCRCYFDASKHVISGVALQLISSLRREVQIAACEKSIFDRVFDSSILSESLTYQDFLTWTNTTLSLKDSEFISFEYCINSICNVYMYRIACILCK
jgi:hypothetical protein